MLKKYVSLKQMKNNPCITDISAPQTMVVFVGKYHSKHETKQVLNTIFFISNSTMYSFLLILFSSHARMLYSILAHLHKYCTCIINISMEIYHFASSCSRISDIDCFSTSLIEKKKCIL